MGFSLSRVADGGRSFAFLAAAAATFVFAFAAAASRRQKVLVDGKRSSGSVVSMWIAGATSQPMERKPTIRCIAGVGIEGDRYSRSLESGRYSVFPEPGRQITIIAAEPMETLQRDLRLDTRRGPLARVPQGRSAGTSALTTAGGTWWCVVFALSCAIASATAYASAKWSSLCTASLSHACIWRA